MKICRLKVDDSILSTENSFTRIHFAFHVPFLMRQFSGAIILANYCDKKCDEKKRASKRKIEINERALMSYALLIHNSTIVHLNLVL